jgi:hypothetical protein
MDSAIETILRSKPSEREVRKAAKPQGIPSMQEDGIIKVLRGLTSLDELRPRCRPPDGSIKTRTVNVAGFEGRSRVRGRFRQRDL